MALSNLDWGIVILFFALTMFIGLWTSRRAGKSVRDYFLSGRDMPWWLLGVSMVATTFSADTPNLVTDIIRKDGIAGNWVWWAFLLTGMATVFIYAKLWRRSGITTDLEFYELRYSGKASTFLRGFRAIYLGVFFNVMIMATVLLAGIKISAIMLGMSAIQTVLLVSVITVIYSSLGGLRGVILTDFFQFILSMIGMVAAAVYIVNLPEIDGISNLINHPNVASKTNFFPDFNDWNVAVPLFLIPIAVQWWSAWYPGAEPGGGGYVAQRMLSSKNEKDAIKATMFFNAAHYALRPWPWILIALASLILFPELSDIQSKFPLVQSDLIAHDLAFPAMMTVLPKGLLGLVIAALIAALMSTISTHLNWGSSYVVNDFYVRFMDKEATQKTQITVGRLSTIILMILSAVMALFLTNAMEAFNILLQIGAGTGLLFLLRWFWWRINAYSEIAAMIISFVLAIYFELIYQGSLESYERMLLSVLITTLVWLSVTLMTRPTDQNTLLDFYRKILPAGGSWKTYIRENGASEDLLLLDQPDANASRLSQEILMMFLGAVMIYGALFFVGYFLFGQWVPASVSFAAMLGSLFGLIKLWK